MFIIPELFPWDKIHHSPLLYVDRPQVSSFNYFWFAIQDWLDSIDPSDYDLKNIILVSLNFSIYININLI